MFLKVDKNAYVGHQGSVEDIQWSPTEATVFCSGSCDKKLMIWDTRGRNGPQISLEAHSEDVNVISWNRTVSNLLASGSDDGSFKVRPSYQIFNFVLIRSNVSCHMGHALCTL